MLYATWHPMPRPPHFPEDPTLDQLIETYDPEIGRFSLQMKRRNARDLRKGLFGPKGVKDAPKGEGMRRFDLPKGWCLLITWGPPGSRTKPGNVEAEFIPP